VFRINNGVGDFKKALVLFVDCFYADAVFSRPNKFIHILLFGAGINPSQLSLLVYKI
jgi:hypothetical protein